MKAGAARRVALTGMLFALAVVLSIFESAIAPFFGLPPGVKLGLANIVVLYALLFLTRWEALTLVLLKAGFALLTRGGVAGAMSLAGGALSLLVMVLLLLPRRQPSILLLSVAGALCFNLGQLALFSVMFGAFAWSYAPVLLVSGVVMGALTALSLRALMPALTRLQTGPPPAVPPPGGNGGGGNGGGGSGGTGGGTTGGRSNDSGVGGAGGGNNGDSGNSGNRSGGNGPGGNDVGDSSNNAGGIGGNDAGSTGNSSGDAPGANPPVESTCTGVPTGGPPAKPALSLKPNNPPSTDTNTP